MAKMTFTWPDPANPNKPPIVIDWPPPLNDQAAWDEFKTYLVWLHGQVDKMHRAIEALEHGQYRGQIAGPILTEGQTPEVLEAVGIRTGLGPDDGQGGGLG